MAKVGGLELAALTAAALAAAATSSSGRDYGWLSFDGGSNDWRGTRTPKQLAAVLGSLAPFARKGASGDARLVGA